MAPRSPRFTFHIVSLFPETMDHYFSTSILGRARRRGLIAVHYYNPKDFELDPKKRIDDIPYGGGPGMVLRPEPVLRAAQAALRRVRDRRQARVWFFSPAGAQFTNEMARATVRRARHLVLLCGRYEGIDERVRTILRAQRTSIGPYILSGGELAAMVVADVCARQVPGVVGKRESLEEERTASPVVYTRPADLIWEGRHYRVPEVLRSGNHAAVAAWRQMQQEVVERKRRS
jgi:tRNA (guanine37-N1)-methyltransferase